MADCLEELGSGQLHRFADWPNVEVPNWCAGAYTIWSGAGALVYAGMAGRGLLADGAPPPPDAQRRRRGLVDRLNSHASGRRSGDQFCIYVFDRFVLPELTAEEVSLAASGTLSLDTRVRSYIRGHLSFRFAVTSDGAEALALERSVRRGRLEGQKPVFNPL